LRSDGPDLYCIHMALREQGRAGFDTPSTPTSSTGERVYPPKPVSEMRKKGIYPSVVSLPRDLSNLASELGAFPFDADTSRFTVRYFVENGALNSLSPEERSNVEQYIEGIVKLEGDGEAFQDCSVIYMGKNSQSRRTTSELFKTEIATELRVFSSKSPEKKYDYSDFTFREISSHDKVDPKIIDQYEELYKAFGWNRDQVTQILQNPTSILIGAFEGDRLVSSGMAERAEFDIERNGVPHKFVMYEITEAATNIDYRGRGIYSKIARNLLKALANTDTDLVYGECNAQSPAVLQASHSLGRTSSIQALAEFGFPPKLLEQHVRIAAGPNDLRPITEKNDLLPTYMTRNKLLQYANEN